MRELQGLGWIWRSNGVEIACRVDGRTMRVFVPITRVWLTFGDEMAAVGYPFPPAVGACTVAGLFGSIKRAVKRHGRKAKRAVRKATKRISRSARKWGGHAVRLARSKYVRHGLKGASFVVPALAPAAAGLEVAHQAMLRYEEGRRAALAIKRGLRSPGDGAKVARALAIRQGTAAIAGRAKRGDRRARQYIGALGQMQRSGYRRARRAPRYPVRGIPRPTPAGIRWAA